MIGDYNTLQILLLVFNIDDTIVPCEVVGGRVKKKNRSLMTGWVSAIKVKKACVLKSEKNSISMS